MTYNRPYQKSPYNIGGVTSTPDTMTASHERERDAGETLDGMEAALREVLTETESARTRYQIRTALQKVEVLRWEKRGEPVERRRSQ